MGPTIVWLSVCLIGTFPLSWLWNAFAVGFYRRSNYVYWSFFMSGLGRWHYRCKYCYFFSFCCLDTRESWFLLILSRLWLLLIIDELYLNLNFEVCLASLHLLIQWKKKKKIVIQGSANGAVEELVDKTDNMSGACLWWLSDSPNQPVVAVWNWFICLGLIYDYWYGCNILIVWCSFWRAWVEFCWHEKEDEK